MQHGSSQFEVVDIRYLANGGFGKVYRAKLVGRHGIGVDVVLKVPYGENPEAFRYAEATMEEESRIQAKMSHPNIVRSMGFFDVSVSCADARELGQSCSHRTVKRGEPSAQHTLPVLVLEDAGTSLGQVMASYGDSIHQDRAVHIAIELLRGLGHLHEEGIVHRDIKPSNALIGRNGEVKIGDLGIAKDRMSELPNTKSNLLKGTVYYMSPEVLCTPPPGQKRPEVDGRADIWAVGVLLYRMLSGHYPFHCEPIEASHDVTVYLDWVRRLENDEITKLPPEKVSPALFAVIEKFLAKNREHRYADTAQAIEALQPFAFPPNICAAELAYRARRAIEHAETELSTSHYDTTRAVEDERPSHRPRPGAKLAGFLGDPHLTDTMRKSRALLQKVPRAGWVKAGAALGLAAAVALGDWVISEPGASAARSLAPDEAAPVPRSGSTNTAKRAPWPAPPLREAPAVVTDVVASPPSLREAPAVVTDVVASPPSQVASPPSQHGVPAPQGMPSNEGPALGTLELVVFPRGAFVSLDGQAPVKAPATFQNLKPGTHALRLGLSRDSLDRVQKVRVRAGKNDIRVVLSNPFGT